MPAKDRSPDPNRPSIALVGCSTLLGKEIKERLSAGRLFASRVQLFETGSREGALTDFAGEAAIALNVEPDSLEDVDLVILACPPADGDRVLSYARKAEALVIDLSGGSSSAAAPVVNWEVNKHQVADHHGLLRAAQPTSLMLSTVLHALESQVAVVSVEAVVFEPASSIGQDAMDELYRQAVNLFNFGSIPRDTFGRQIAFNLLPLTLAPALGGSERERSLARETLRVLGWEEGKLSLKMMLAPVFHCHAALIRFTPAGSIQPSMLLSTLGRMEPLSADSAGAEEGPGTPVEWAGEAKIRIMEVREDGRGDLWMWALVDDLKAGAALNAVRIAEALFPPDRP